MFYKMGGMLMDPFRKLILIQEWNVLSIKVQANNEKLPWRTLLKLAPCNNRDSIMSITSMKNITFDHVRICQRTSESYDVELPLGKSSKRARSNN